jgi:16S rRNA (guanine966-N2)-methyltransferase
LLFLRLKNIISPHIIRPGFYLVHPSCARPNPIGLTLLSKNKDQLRIIGGQWRSRKLPIPEVDGLRPSSDRLRETLFNWLAPDIHGARSIDMFAGTGALGLEALSRGAHSCHFIELDRGAALQLEQNLKLLKAQNATIFRGDALSWRGQERYDIAFLDPPFAKDLWQRASQHIDSLLENDALIYVESPSDAALELPSHWREYKSTKAGNVKAQLFERCYNGGR